MPSRLSCIPSNLNRYETQCQGWVSAAFEMLTPGCCTTAKHVKFKILTIFFTVEFGVRKHYLVWPPFASRSATHLLRIELIGLLIAACGACEMLVHSSSMAVRSCRILAGTGTRCRIRRSRASKTCSIGDMSGEYAGHARTGMFSASRNCVQILATWGFALSCCNMRWCHGWMAQQWASEPRHVSLCIQNAINKMHLCSLFITYACPYHNPTATMGHSIHNVNISKPLTHTTPYTLSAICPVQWKSGFIREENTSLKCQTPSNVSICPLKSPTMMNWVSVRDPDEDDEHADELPWDVSDSLCRNYLVMQTNCCSSCPDGWSQTILEVKMLDVEVLGWCGYTGSAVVRPVGCTAKFY